MKKTDGFVIPSPKLLTCDSEWGEGSRRCSWGWLPGLGFVARAGFRYTYTHMYYTGMEREYGVGMVPSISTKHVPSCTDDA